MMDLSRISYSSTIYAKTPEGLERANVTLKLAIETALEGETFDLFDNGRGYVIRMFEDGEFVQTI
jgi:hypothetical protein